MLYQNHEKDQMWGEIPDKFAKRENKLGQRGQTGMPDKDTLMQGFQMGPWFVLPERGLLSLDGEEKHIEPLVMDVLMALAERAGEVLSNDQLIDAAWGGRAVTDDVIVRCIAVLRRNLGDNAREPEYIENIPRRGYRLMKSIEVPQLDPTPAEAGKPVPAARSAYYWPLVAGFVAVVLITVFAFFAPIDEAEDNHITSLAVFPMDCSAEDANVCYSIVEELVSQLLQAQDAGQIKVVRSRAPFPTDPDEESIADELDVDGIFIGRLVRTGSDIRISAEIQDRQDGEHGFVLWSNSYDGPSVEVIELRSRLVSDAVGELIGDDAKSLKADSRPSSLAALDAYAAGQYELSKRSEVATKKAIDLFEKTIELDPEFAPAYVRLAYGYMLLPEYGPASATLMYEKALLSADAGVAIDPRVSGPAQTVYGFVYHKRNQWTKATQAHLNAINASTVYPISHQLYSRLLASVGRLDASLTEARKAHEIDPQQAVQISRLAIAYFWLDDLENAATYFQQSDEHMEYVAPIHDLAYSLFHIRNGDYDKAVTEAITGLEKYGQDSSWVASVFAGMHNPEKYDEAHAIVAHLSDEELLPANVEISLWTLLKDADRAMAVAKRLENAGEIFEAELMFVPQFSAFREHPYFPTLLDAIGLTEYWNENDCEWAVDRVVCEQSDIVAPSSN